MKSKQVDVTCAFLHADLAPGETIYVDMPFRFNTKSKNGKQQVLKLNKTLYGLSQSPRAFWKYITKKLKLCGLKQSKFDPCLFIGPDVMCIVYLNDLIFWSCDITNIDRLAMELCKLGVALEQEDGAAGKYWAAQNDASLWVWMMVMLVVSIRQPKQDLSSRMPMV